MSEHPKDGNEEYDSDVVEEDADRKEDDGCLSVSRQDKKTSSLRQRGKAKATSTITEGSSINSVTDENVSKPAKVSTKSVIIRTVSYDDILRISFQSQHACYIYICTLPIM